MNELAWLALWTILWVVQHLGMPTNRVRPRLVAAMGERGYLVLYSVLTIILLVLLVLAWLAARPAWLLWPTYELLRWVPVVLMPVALLLIVTGLIKPNPAMIGTVLEDDEEVPVQGIIRVTRDPVQCGILLWALSHCASNGDVPSLLLFGSFAVVSGAGMVLLDRRRRNALGENWAAFCDATSLLPFGAILSGKQSLKLAEIGLLSPVLAAAIFVALWWGHVWVSGTPVGVGW